MLSAKETVALFSIMEVRGIGPVQANRFVQRLSSVGLTLTDAIAGNVKENFLHDFFSDEILDHIKKPNPRLEEQTNELVKGGAQFLAVTDRHYPAHLRKTLQQGAPPVLTCRGNIDLFQLPAVGFCGSRKASTRGIETAMDCAELFAREDVVAISGNAAGVDTAAHRSVLAAGGSTIIVIPEGMLRFKIRQDLSDVWDWERILVISEFAPGLPWSARGAMQRNKTIIGLSDVLVVVEASTTGGTMNAGRTALELGTPLFAAVYDGVPNHKDGNKILVKNGATAFGKSLRTGRAAVNSLLTDIRERFNARADIDTSLFATAN